MLASTWMDMVIGVDIHFEMVPMPAPVPTPIPNPFIGIVNDPVGLAVGLALGAALALATGGTPTGPVLIYGLPATNVGTEAKGMGHILIPPGVSWAPMPKFPSPTFRGPPSFPGLPIKPEDEATSIMGSTTVSVMGTSAVRMGEAWMSCGEPLRLPSSVVIAIPKGPIVLIGGPPGVNLMDALLAMIKTKWVAGYLHSLISRIKNVRLRNALNKIACFLTGHPVDVATGRLLTDHVDFALPGSIPLVFERCYASSWADRDGPLGRGWSHSLDQAVWAERGKLVYLAEDGREIEFDVFDFPEHSLPIGEEVYDPINQLTLRYKRRDLVEIETHSGDTLEFAPPKARSTGPRSQYWRIQRRRNRAGNQLQFSYDARDNLQWVRDSGGRVIGFEHNEHDRLIRVLLPHPEQEGFIDYVRYEYDAEGDLVRVIDANGASWTFAYKRHLMVRETNRNGLSFYFAYDGFGAEAYCVRTWGDGGIYDHVIDYAKGIQTVVTNSLGHKTTYKLNPIGQVVELIDARGGSTKYEYDERTLKLIKEVDPIGGETKTSYDERGNISKVELPDASSMTVEYSALNQPERALDALGGEWRWSYDSAGRVIGAANPANERNQFHWGDAGLIALTDAAGQHTQLAYDAAGNLISFTTPNGAEAGWSHDRLGRRISSRDENGNQRRFERDALGRVTRVLEPDGNERTLEYDAEGNVVRARDRHYDVFCEYRGMNRLAARSQAGVRVEFLYDTEEQVVAIKNEHGLAYRFVLDGNGDVAEEYGFDDLRRVYERDAAGRTTLVRRADKRETRYTRDALDRVLTIAHSDGSSEAYTYRADGALISAQNDASKLVFERDSIGRLLRELQGDEWVSSSYDALGQRAQLRSSKGLFQRIRRNDMGDVLAIEAEVIGVPAASHSGSAASETDVGRAIRNASFSARFQRDQLGLELERELPGGVRARWQRDKLGRPVRTELWRGGQFHDGKQYVWDVDDRLTRVIDAMTGPIDYTHDAVGNLAAATYADGKVDLRMPDAVGNLFRTGDRSDRKYGPAGQLLESHDTRGVTRYDYDTDGNLVEKIDPSGAVWRYEWNGAGRLSRVTRPDGNTVTFSYDALARRISKVYRGKVTRWIWDGNVPLHEWVEGDGGAQAKTRLRAQTEDAVAVAVAEKALQAMLAGRPANGPPSATDAATREAPLAAASLGVAEMPITWLFEPGSFAPLAKLVDGQAFAIVTDYLGTPQAMFDSAGREVWGADVDAYGELRNLRGEKQACPFRWPGQYEDAETGLYYNRFRYYLAEQGQYISQDPIGLLGGSALYGYVQNPIDGSDPLGLVERLFRYTDTDEAKQAASNLGGDDNLHPRMHGTTESRGPKWVTEAGAPRRVPGKPVRLDIEVEDGTIAWLRENGVDFETVAGETAAPDKVLRKANEPGSHGVGRGLLDQLNERIKKITATDESKKSKSKKKRGGC